MDLTANSGPCSASRARRLTTHQIAVLVQVLLNFPDQRVSVCHASSSIDAGAYAEDFVAVFKALNWTVDSLELSGVLAHHYLSGLAIVVENQQLPPSAEALRDALRIYNIETETLLDTSHLSGARTFVLAVS